MTEYHMPVVMIFELVWRKTIFVCASIGSVMLPDTIVASSHINKVKLTRIPTKNGQEKHGHNTPTFSLREFL